METSGNYTTAATPGDYDSCYSDTDSQDAHNASESETTDPFMTAIYNIATPIIFSLITITGVIGNSLVIYVIVSREEMRKLTNLMLLNLAVADICFLMITPPFTAYISTGTEWIFGDAMCKIVNCALNLTVYVTVYTLVLICVVRYIAIVHHGWSAKFRTRKNITIAILSIWIVMFLAVIPFGRIFGVCSEGGVKKCSILKQEYARDCFTFSTVFAYVFPLAVVACLSGITYRHIHKKSEIADHSTSPGHRHKQAGHVIFFVVLAFALLWLPVHVDILWYYWSGYQPEKVHHILGVAARSLAYFNSCVNPIIYNFTSKEFRRHFWEVTHCVRTPPSSQNTFKSSTRRTELTMDNLVPLLEQKKDVNLTANNV